MYMLAEADWESDFGPGIIRQSTICPREATCLHPGMPGGPVEHLFPESQHATMPFMIWAPSEGSWMFGHKQQRVRTAVRTFILVTL